MTCYYPLSGYRHRETGGLCFRADESIGQKLEVACGSCIGCRLDRSRDWAIRCVHESELHDDNCFITLTYEVEPPDGSLVKSDLQKFFKRLRKKIRPKKVRYYACGEYGDKDGRPHYHAILFGLDFDDKELISEKDGNLLYTSKMLSDTWGLGFVTVGAATFESAAYIARYILKKVTGERADDHYLRCDEYGVAYWLEPEYTVMSRRPGIGKAWYDKFKDDLWPSDEVPVPGRGVFKKVPRYYQKILANEDPMTLEEMQRVRAVFMKEHGEEYEEERLIAREKVQKAKVEFLTREI